MHQALILEKNGNDKKLMDIINYNGEEELRDKVINNISLLEHDSIFEAPLICIGKENDGRDITALTAEGIPVIVETKLAHNQDLRDVIAQIFDYASRLNQTTFQELNEWAKSLYSNPDYRGEHRGLDLIKAFMHFQESISDGGLQYNEKSIIIEINKNLREGNFILLLVVDSIREDVLRSIKFLNSKLEILRIEVIEVFKYQSDKIILYSSSHINRDTDKRTRRTQVKKTYEDLCENWTKILKESIDIFKFTLESNGFEFINGAAGLPVKYNNQPIMFLRKNHIQIATPMLERNGHKDLSIDLLNLIKEKFVNSEKTLIQFKLTDKQQDITPIKMESFAKNLIDICAGYFNDNE